MLFAIWQHCRPVAVVQVPYFVSVSLATVLQLSIKAMSWGGTDSTRQRMATTAKVGAKAKEAAVESLEMDLVQPNSTAFPTWTA